MDDMKSIAVNQCFWNDAAGNYGSRTDLLSESILEQLTLCWHMRMDYFCDGYIRVPVPPTNGGKAVFFTNVVPASMLKRGSVVMNLESFQDSIPAIFYMVPRANCEVPEVKTKYVDLILANRDARVRDKLGGSRREWEVVNFHAMPEKDVPPPPLTMARHLSGPHAASYRYTNADFTKSVLFWSRHVAVVRP